MPVSYQCVNCIQFEGSYEGKSNCKAFPEGGSGIPEEIFSGKHDHRKEFKGDNGIRYEPVSKELDNTFKDDI